MKRAILTAAAAFVLLGAGIARLTTWPIGEKPALGELEGNADRGAYLARMSGCIACHTNAEGGGAPLAGGLALETDFGTFYSPNLTTDEVHGIGAWTPETFAKAVRQGISPDGAPYYPAFPYPFYSKFSDQDIADLWAAFQTVPPVAEPSKPQEMQFPFSFRPGLKLWRAMFLEPEPFQPDGEKSEQWNRGKFIVEGPAHCGACHTPRNILGAREVEFRDSLPKTIIGKLSKKELIAEERAKHAEQDQSDQDRAGDPPRLEETKGL